ncbi:OmpA family protein [Methylibium sp.]|jgi:outer membrane protein OmpA-like peptidoglycan-associated protein|uniref:OmpA family protein n=1 Tax=Methylibium sp. TaxID=2067992 RepID=UPI003D0E9293
MTITTRKSTPSSLSIVALTAAALLAGGCANMSQEQQDTAKGAGIGAAVGAVAGVLIGDSKKGAATGAAIGALGGAVAGNVWSKKMEEKRRAMEQSTQGTGVDVTRTADNQLKLNVPSDISFDTGKSAIKPELRTVLDSFANGLANDPALQVRVIGHTDSTGSDAINNPLSVDRAQSVRDYLAGRGIQPTRIETSGRGSHEPIADNTSDAGRAKNRRVEILLREPEQAGAATQPKS